MERLLAWRPRRESMTDGTAHFVRYESGGMGYRLFCRTVPSGDGSVALVLSWSLQGSLPKSCSGREAYVFISKWENLLETALRKASIQVEKIGEC